ncbi:COG1470 family protein [Chitinophaga sp. 22321]|nr:NEW3 domain-containing protein [Chitinophaga hostae]
MSASYQGRMKLNPHALLSVVFLIFLFTNTSATRAEGRAAPPFTARLINIEAAANTTFTYNTQLHNTAPMARIYQLSASIPPGWNLSFKVEGVQVTSLNIDSGKTQDITVEINPAVEVKPGKYTIPVLAMTGTDSLKLQLEAVVKGTYSVILTTPTGRLSDDLTEGKRKEIQLLVKNTGTITLDNLDLSGQTPPQWEASFVPSTITRLEPGKDAAVTATLHVPDKTIAGDYVTTFSVKNNSTSSNAAFRMTVKTSVLTGWMGVLVILLALGTVYYLIRKYGRR